MDSIGEVESREVGQHGSSSPIGYIFIHSLTIHLPQVYPSPLPLEENWFKGGGGVRLSIFLHNHPLLHFPNKFMQYNPCALRSWTNLPIFLKFPLIWRKPCQIYGIFIQCAISLCAFPRKLISLPQNYIHYITS